MKWKGGSQCCYGIQHQWYAWAQRASEPVHKQNTSKESNTKIWANTKIWEG